jgi:iron(III) transport system substrate-binding protein
MRGCIIAAALLAALTPGLSAREVNIYSSRHYASDEAIYADFTKQTGIAVNRKEGKPEELLELIKAQGAASPADVFVTVDAGNIWKAEQAGVLAPFVSNVIAQRVPANLREPSGLWFAAAKRVRLIFVDAARADALNVRTYADLADPRLKGKVCARQSSNVYNLSFLASMIAKDGAQRAETWARGVVANFARTPQGGDIDQLLGIASGECVVALSNHYYFVRLQREPKPESQGAAGKIKPIFPDQNGAGAHVNVTAAGLLKSAPNKAEAKEFLEFLVSDAAQNHFASLTNEYPVVETVALPPALAAFGAFKTDGASVSVYGARQAEAQQIYDRAGWK